MNETFVIGGYTGGAGSGRGIEAVRQRSGTAPDGLGTAALVDSTSYLAKHPRLGVVYAACEMTKQVRAFTVQAGARPLEPLGARPGRPASTSAMSRWSRGTLFGGQ